MSDQTTPALPPGFDPNRKPIPKSELPPPPREVLAGAPSLLPLGPWKVHVGKFTWGERKAILQLVQDRTPQPLAEFRRRLDLLAGHEAAQQQLVKDFLDGAYIADRDWPPAFLSPEFLAVIFAPEHVPDVLRLALDRLNPALADALAAYAESLPQMEEVAVEAFIKEYEHVIERWLVGPRPETRDSIRGAIGPKGEGGDPLPETTPPPASESTATSPPSSASCPPTSTG